MPDLVNCKPLFPASGLPPRLLECPRIGKSSSKFSRRFWFYVHEYLLLPLSQCYTRFYNITSEPSTHPLPFGSILKRNERVREQEGLGMNLARAMGVPAPKFIYGSLDSSYHFSSILMTRLLGKPLDSLPDTEIDYDAIKEDVIRILTRMRSYASPWGKRVCGVAGGPICGPMIPGCPMPACKDEAAFQDSIRYITGFSGRTGRDAEHVRKGEEFFALPKHAIVFTHGDLNYHNIMVGSDGHICGIFDWEAAGWLPEYWEISVTAILPTRNWGRFMDKEVSLGVYEAEIQGHRAIFPLIADSLSY